MWCVRPGVGIRKRLPFDCHDQVNKGVLYLVLDAHLAVRSVDSIGTSKQMFDCREEGADRFAERTPDKYQVGERILLLRTDQLLATMSSVQLVDPP